MKLRGLVIGIAVGGFVVAGGVKACAAKTTRHTIEDRVATIVAKKPQLKGVAKSSGGKLKIFVFKNERSVEVHAPGWRMPRIYPMTAFSGALGPKLREGDGQIPEGVYGIEYLNPNSSYHLSLKVSYPNASDRKRAKADGRTNLGGDIMIHGKAVTIGCVPVGDDAIEDGREREVAHRERERAAVRDAAAVGAAAAVAAAALRHRGVEAEAGDGVAESPVDEDFDLGAALADDARDLVERALAGEDDAGEAEPGERADALDGMRGELRRGVELERGEAAAGEARDAEVLDDERVGGELLEVGEGVEDLGALAVERERVERDVDLARARQGAGVGDQGAEAVEAEVLGVGARGEARKARVDRVRPGAERGEGGVEGAGGGDGGHSSKAAPGGQARFRLEDAAGSARLDGMSTTTIQAFRMHLKPGNEAEYARRHAQLWPEMKELQKVVDKLRPAAQQICPGI